jgi:hypothetical protein
MNAQTFWAYKEVKEELNERKKVNKMKRHIKNEEQKTVEEN